MSTLPKTLEQLAEIVESDDNPGLVGAELDAWNVATMRAARLIRESALAFGVPAPVAGDGEVEDFSSVGASSDGGLAGDLRSVQLELSLARSWAWAEYHRFWDASWFAPSWEPRSPQDEWQVPDWLSTSVEPSQQRWFVDPRP